MSATVTTTEKFAIGTTKTAMDEEVRLRIKASAITSKHVGSQETGWTLTTVWNVIGEQ